MRNKDHKLASDALAALIADALVDAGLLARDKLEGRPGNHDRDRRPKGARGLLGGRYGSAASRPFQRSRRGLPNEALH